MFSCGVQLTAHQPLPAIAMSLNYRGVTKGLDLTVGLLIHLCRHKLQSAVLAENDKLPIINTRRGDKL